MSIKQRVGWYALTATLIIGGLVWYSLYTDSRIAQIERQQEAMIDDANRLLAEALERARLKEQARQAQLAASNAAEQAKMARTAEDVRVIDSAACNTASEHNDPSRSDVLVNKTHCLQPLTYEPNDLVTVYGAIISAKASSDFQQLYQAAQAAGMGFFVTSSYRSYENQITTYQYWVGTSGYDGADTYSARPGYSEHQTGLAIDVAAGGCTLDCFGSTAQYQWLQANAARYGFIQRYYAGSEEITGFKSEEWHYRYVGRAVAEDMRSRGIKSLEEYWGMTGGQYTTAPADS